MIKEASNTSELFSIAAAIFVLIVIISLPGGSAGAALLISDIYIVPDLLASGSVTEVILEPEVHRVGPGLQQALAIFVS